MPLTRRQHKVLREAGFMRFERRRISRAKAPDGSYQNIDLTGATWQATIESRRRWILNRLDTGWTEEEIANAIRRYYRKRRGRTVWDWLKIEYKPPKRLSDFQFALKLRARVRISRGLGKDYGRRMIPERRPIGR